MSDSTARLNEALEGRYVVEGQLGEGGMATVYLASDVRHDRKVAIKVLKPELSAVIGADRFLAEISTTANLQHPHILPLHDSGEVDGTVFYVMPYVEGESLRQRMDREKQLRVADAVRIAAEIADALDYAHRQGVVHRDIKPENILMHDGRALVADFGIALAASRTEGSQRLTETGMSLGTPHYMSPEQAMGEPDIDGRTDVYALGCILYEMLTGEPPFTAPSAQAIVAKLISSEPESITALRKTVPPHVAGAAHTALEKLPADRFATAAEMVAALADETRTLHTRATANVSSGGAGRARLVPWIVAAVAVVAAIGAFMSRPTGDDALRGAKRFALIRSGDGEAVPRAFPYMGGGDIAIAPDGSVIVFVGISDGVTRLYRRSLDDRSVRVLAGTEGASYPTISPDGRSVAFSRPDGAIARMSLDGGAPSSIAKPAAPPIGIGWSQEFGLIFGMLGFIADVPGISRMAPSGDTTLHIVTVPSTPAADTANFAMHHNPSVLPDGETVAFLEVSEAGVRLGLLSLAGGAAEITDVNAFQIVGAADGLLFFVDPGRVLMAVQYEGDQIIGSPVAVPGAPASISSAAISSSGTLAMTLQPLDFEVLLVDERGNLTRRVLADSTREFLGRFSPDGSAIALRGDFSGTSRAWTYDLRTETLSPLPLGFFPRSLYWSADGRRVIATGGRDAGTMSLAADASDAPELFFDAGDRRLGSTALSPDGRTLLLTEAVGSNPMLLQYDLVLATLESGVITDFVTSEANEVAGRFSADGRWVAYASNESGRYEVYTRPFPGPGARIQISSGGGAEPVWSRDGRRLFYRAGTEFLAADLVIDAAGTLEVTGRTALFEGEFFGATEEDALEARYDVTPDGTRFLVARAVGDTGREIVVWTDWLHEVKALFNEGS